MGKSSWIEGYTLCGSRRSRIAVLLEALRKLFTLVLPLGTLLLSMLAG